MGKIVTDATTFDGLSDVLDGTMPVDNVVLIYDDDHYSMGGVLAELLVKQRAKVTLIPSWALGSDLTNNTSKQVIIHRMLAEMGNNIVLNRGVIKIFAGLDVSNGVHTDQPRLYEIDTDVQAASLLENDLPFRREKSAMICPTKRAVQ